jgi:hypothetical protein
MEIIRSDRIATVVARVSGVLSTVLPIPYASLDPSRRAPLQDDRGFTVGMVSPYCSATSMGFVRVLRGLRRSRMTGGLQLSGAHGRT